MAAIKRADYEARWERGGKRIGEYEDFLRGGTEQSLADVEHPAASDSKDGLEDDKFAQERNKTNGIATSHASA